MHSLVILFIVVSLVGQLIALLVSISSTSLITTTSMLKMQRLLLLFTHSEDNLLALTHLFASNRPLHAAWQGCCREWTRKTFLRIRNIIVGGPNSLLLQALLLDSWCIEKLAFEVDPSALVGLFGSLPAWAHQSSKASISSVEKLDVYGLWRRNAILCPEAFRVFHNVPLHRIIGPYQAARNKYESFQALFFVYGRKRLRQPDFEAVAGTMFLLIFPMTRPKASNIAQKLMDPSDPEEDQASFQEILDICQTIIGAGGATPLHSIATWMVESGILRGEEAKEVFPHSLITVDSSHEITRLSLLLTLLSGAPSLEFIQAIQARLQECPIVEYIDLLFAISWTKPTSGLFDTIVGSTRSRLIGLSPRFLGRTKSVIISQLTISERKQMFHNSVRAFADSRFNQLRGEPVESRIFYFYDTIKFKSIPPADFPNTQQFLTAILEDSLTRLVDLHVKEIDGQRTLAFRKTHELEQRIDKSVISLAFYLQMHFDFKETSPVIVASSVHEYIHDVGQTFFLKRLLNATRWV